MDAWAELCRACARRRAEELGGLSESAFRELRAAVDRDPAAFVTHDAERALLVLARALDRVAQDRAGDDLLDDEAFEHARARRMARLAEECSRALELDAGCLDARTLRAVALHDTEPEELLGALLRLEQEAGPLGEAGNGPEATGASDDAAAGTAGGPVAPDAAAPDAGAPSPARLRLADAVARSCLDTARHRMARERCLAILDAAPDDPCGTRLTLALVLARLEDEEALDALDARFGRRGSAWMSLARSLLLFKLDRLPAARRALADLRRRCEGAAYALLRPTYVDAYLPDRPSFRPGSHEEALLATHEADPVVSDTPDFCTWAAEQPDVEAEARAFARDRGLDW